MDAFSSVDYLFDETLFDQQGGQLTEFPSDQRKTDLFFRFDTLPAELRNNIYERAVIPKPRILKINEFGKIVLPSITRVSKQLYAETEGYVKFALEDPTTKIHAQVRDYNLGPLIETLENFSKLLEISKEDLFKRTKVFTVGQLNYTNLHQWVRQYLNDPNNIPIPDHKKDPHGSSVFTGRTSLTSFIRQFDIINPSRWNRICQEFFSLADEAGFQFNFDGCQKSSSEASSANNGLLKLVAEYHHEILQNSRAGRSTNGGGSVLRDLAELIFYLHTVCNKELLAQWGAGGALFVDAINYTI